jgi:hypothetical protein
MMTDTNVQLNLFGGEDCRPLDAHVWPKEAFGYYVEPAWVPERLFAVEKFLGSIWDPGCGRYGRVLEAAGRAGYETYATDLVNRGYEHFDRALNFLLCERRLGDNIVCNPPFHICDAFLQHALKLDPNAVAMIWLARRLNAAHWLPHTPLARVHLLSPRPSMPPGRLVEAGEKPRGGKQDFVWLVWRRGHVGPPELRWLHRDGGQP